MIWSRRRRWLGNFVPFAPSATAAILAAKLGLGIWSLAVAVLIAIPLISRYGFYENSQIREELAQKHPGQGDLVGFVFDRPADWLDAHAEVGFLNVRNRKIEVRTEDRLLTVPLTPNTRLSRGFNIHKIVGLGGWIVIDNDEVPTLKLESRSADTMYASKLRTAQLFERLRQEKGGSEEPPISNQLA